MRSNKAFVKRTQIKHKFKKSLKTLMILQGYLIGLSKNIKDLKINIIVISDYLKSFKKISILSKSLIQPTILKNLLN